LLEEIRLKAGNRPGSRVPASLIAVVAERRGTLARHKVPG